jgi:RAT1-interacting protein
MGDELRIVSLCTFPMKRPHDLASTTFAIPPIRSLRQATPYSQPKEMAHFSYSPQRELLFDRSALNYFLPKATPIDLNTGYPERYIQRKSDIEPLDSLLLAIKHQRVPIQTAFCTWRGIITKIMCTPYCLQESWELVATKYNGVIYLMEYDSGERAQQRVAYENADLFTYYGYKFEAECTGNEEGVSEEPVTVNTNVQYCSVFMSKLGALGITMGAEVDCLLRKPKSDAVRDIQAEYTELKTHKVMSHPRQKTSFVKFKLLKTWAQSFLVGIRNVVFGFRDEKGYIQEITTFETSEFPRMSRKEELWDPNVCLCFGSRALEFIRASIEIDDINTTYRINYHPTQRQIEIQEPEKGTDLVFLRNELFY